MFCCRVQVYEKNTFFTILKSLGRFTFLYKFKARNKRLSVYESELLGQWIPVGKPIYITHLHVLSNRSLDE